MYSLLVWNYTFENCSFTFVERLLMYTSHHLGSSLISALASLVGSSVQIHTITSQSQDCNERLYEFCLRSFWETRELAQMVLKYCPEELMLILKVKLQTVEFKDQCQNEDPPGFRLLTEKFDKHFVCYSEVPAPQSLCL